MNENHQLSELLEAERLTPTHSYLRLIQNHHLTQHACLWAAAGSWSIGREHTTLKKCPETGTSSCEVTLRPTP